jgi:hypothetical protein
MTIQKWWRETLSQVERDTNDASVLMGMIREFWLGKMLGCSFIIGFCGGLFVTDIDGALGIAFLACVVLLSVFGLLIIVAWIFPPPFAWLARKLWL